MLADDLANLYLERILTASVYDLAVETPLEVASRLSQRFENTIYLKREDTQPVFSFKLRGAYNCLAALPPEVRQRGVIASSAGNHAQGVALSAQRLGISALIVMPQTTPQIKVDAVRRLGAEVILHGDRYADAYQHACTLQQQRNLTFVHPYDDPAVIAGQGTIAMEILRQLRQETLDAVFVPVGGGGLIAGIAVYLKRLKPEIKVIGVEPVGAAAMTQSLAAAQRLWLPKIDLFADGVAVNQVGAEPFRLCQHFVDDMVTVETDEICAAIKDVFEDTRSILEPAGALAVAGLKAYIQQHECVNQRFVAVASGANTNFDRLRFIAERADVGRSQEVLLAVTIPEVRGSFRDMSYVLRDILITELSYRVSDQNKAQVFLSLNMLPQHLNKVTAQLQAQQWTVTNLTCNELAKAHVRYLAGGRGRSDLSLERLFRFEFPERAGALFVFVERMSVRWNVTLFHYRTHGLQYGSVLVGLEIPSQDHAEFQAFLQDLGYVFCEESGNVAYDLFLA